MKKSKHNNRIYSLRCDRCKQLKSAEYDLAELQRKSQQQSNTIINLQKQLNNEINSHSQTKLTLEKASKEIAQRIPVFKDQ